MNWLRILAVTLMLTGLTLILFTITSTPAANGQTLRNCEAYRLEHSGFSYVPIYLKCELPNGKTVECVIASRSMYAGISCNWGSLE